MRPETIAGVLEALDAATTPSFARFRGTPGERLIVLPSAFNPPTLAHVDLLGAAIEVAGGASALALLSTRNVAKGVFGATLPDRVAMLLAAAGEGPLGVGATNAARFADQAEALREALPGTAIDFAVGYDTLVRIFDRRYYDDMPSELAGFFAEHRIFAANRAGTGPAGVAAYLDASAEVAPFRERISVIAVADTTAALSSTRARDLAEQGGLEALVPAAVAGYIRRHGLYRGAGGDG